MLSPKSAGLMLDRAGAGVCGVATASALLVNVSIEKAIDVLIARARLFLSRLKDIKLRCLK